MGDGRVLVIIVVMKVNFPQTLLNKTVQLVAVQRQGQDVLWFSGVTKAAGDQ